MHILFTLGALLLLISVPYIIGVLATKQEFDNVKHKLLTWLLGMALVFLITSLAYFIYWLNGVMAILVETYL